jgi:hypothetical protein
MKVQHRKYEYAFILCTHSYVAREWRFCVRSSLNISTIVLLLYMFSRGKPIDGVKLRNTKEVGQNKLP